MNAGPRSAAPAGVPLDPGSSALVLAMQSTIDALGAATFPIPLPNLPALFGVMVFAHVGVFDSAVPLGYGLTPARRIVLW